VEAVFPSRHDRSHFPLLDRRPQKPRLPQPGFFSLGTVTLTQSATAAPSTPVVAAICAAEILSLAGFSIVPALLPQFIETWSLTNTQAGWLAGITSAGYMLAVIPLVSLTERRPARQIYLAASVLSALSCFGMALSDSLLPALGFRALAGTAMAGMYMPGLRALTHGVEGAIRARIAAWYTSSFTIGASLSFLFGRVGTLLGWRSAFVLAGILGAAGALIAWAALPRGDSGGEEQLQPLLDFRPVVANRDVLALTVGYAAAIWGCVGLRQWIVVFLTFRAGDQAADPAQAWTILVVGAVINFLGVPAGLIGNELSIRYGLRTIATLVFVLSAFAGGLFGFRRKFGRRAWEHRLIHRHVISAPAQTGLDKAAPLRRSDAGASPCRHCP